MKKHRLDLAAVLAVAAAASCTQILGFDKDFEEVACEDGLVQACYSGPDGTRDVGACKAGTRTCSGGVWGACIDEVLPGTEACNDVMNMAIDEDCDGKVNEQGADCVCGDGFISVDMGEECDDGNTEPTDSCTATCQNAECGDGIVQTVLGETCDDGATLDGDVCSPACQEQKVLQLKLGDAHSCALLSGGRVKCWGRNDLGQLGLGDTHQRGDEPDEMGGELPFVNLGTAKTAIAIAAGQHHSCAILNDGTLKCWGTNNLGQLGLGDMLARGDAPDEMGDKLPPVDLGTGKTATMVAASYGHTCALLNDGTLKCWGFNCCGQLGLPHLTMQNQNRGDDPNEMGDNLPPVDLGTGKTAIAITAGWAATCALLNDGTLKCWGNNDSGELGQGDTLDRGLDPSQMGDNLNPVDLGLEIAQFASGDGHTCARSQDMLKCWGRNKDGQLGLGDTENRGDGPDEMGDKLPVVNLGSGNRAIGITVSPYAHSCALLQDASVKCWGFNANGELGLGDTDSRGGLPGQMGDNLPAVKLGTGRTATTFAAGVTHTCALLDDSTLKCWGANSNGQLGLGDTQNRGDNPGEMGDDLPTVKLFSPVW